MTFRWCACRIQIIAITWVSTCHVCSMFAKVFSLLQNAGKLLWSSPTFGQVPQESLCVQVVERKRPPHPSRSMTYVCWARENRKLAYQDIITPPHRTPSQGLDWFLKKCIFYHGELWAVVQLQPTTTDYNRLQPTTTDYNLNSTNFLWDLNCASKHQPAPYPWLWSQKSHYSILLYYTRLYYIIFFTAITYSTDIATGRRH